MNVAVVGTGYVGLVTGVCLANTGNHVIGVDSNTVTVEQLSRGESTIYEPGLSELLKVNINAGRFRVTSDLTEAVHHAEIIFICIGTPSLNGGKANTSMVLQAADKIARTANGPKILVMKSTVPVGTGAKIESTIRPLSHHKISVVSNPEFLKEGSAVADFQKPDRVVIGAEDAMAADRLEELYLPFVRNGHPVVKVRRAAAEMIKYAANGYLATRISYINQVANLCEKLGIDVNEVREGIGYDARIGSHFMYPGIGYGGSCFPKDVQALSHIARDAECASELFDAVHAINERQKSLLVDRIQEHFDGALSGKIFAIWGIAFKPQTDDIRESPAIQIIDLLLKGGAKVRASDPKALDNPNLREQYGERLELFYNAFDALRGADALVICTEWSEYRSPDFDRIKAELRLPVIFDGRNLYSPTHMKELGLTYYSIGRPPV